MWKETRYAFRFRWQDRGQTLSSVFRYVPLEKSFDDNLRGVVYVLTWDEDKIVGVYLHTGGA